MKRGPCHHPLFLAAVLAIGLALSGCSSASRKKVVIYSPHGRDMLTFFEKEYEAAYPGVDVQWLDMGSQDAYDRIRTEKENPQADVWWGAPMSIFLRAERENLLARYVPTWDGAVAADLKSPDGYWYGTFITPEVIMYNNRRVTREEAPEDWNDLLDEQWREKIIIRYPLASGTMRTIFSALIDREIARTGNPDGWYDWFLRLDANTKSYAADPTQLYLRIAREEGLVSVWNLPDVLHQVRLNNYPFGFVLPRSGTPLITDCIGIVRGSKNPEQAKQFYEFVTSRESMMKQAHEFMRIPTRTDIGRDDLPEWIRSLEISSMPVDWTKLEREEKSWMKQWDERVKGKGRTIR